MMETYCHRQFGRQIVTLATIVWVAVAIPEYLTGSYTALIIASVLLVPMVVVFSTMTIAVRDTHLEWWLAFGLFKQSVALSEFEAVSELSVGLAAGLGLRTANGRDWLWIVNGPSALSFQLTNGRSIALGTDDLENLLAAVNRHRSLDG